MANMPSNPIPAVDENVVDVSAATNDALRVVDLLLQTAVVSVGLNAPPGSPADAARYIVGPAGTGAWEGHSNQLARWNATPGYWEFAPARYALNLTDSRMWARTGATWARASGTDTGWTAGTGTPNKGAFNAATATAAETAARVLAIEQALIGLGLLST